MTLRRYQIALAMTAVALFAVSCGEAEVLPGSGTLPLEMETFLVPSAESSLYVYFHSETPVLIDDRLFSSEDETEVPAVISRLLSPPDETAPPPADPLSSPPLPGLPVSTVAMTVSTLDEYAGTLKFATEADAAAAQQMYSGLPIESQTQTYHVSDTIHIARGTTPWIGEVRTQFEAGTLVPFQQVNPNGWNLLTNLPVSEEDRPLAAGIVSMDGDLLKSLADDIGIMVPGLETAFGIVRVNQLAFGVYGDLPAVVPQDIDVEFLNLHNTGVVMVSGTGYPGVGVAFLIRSIAGKLGMDTIDMESSHARYLQVEGAHLVLNNKGSLVYATLAGTRARAEELMARALAE